jgi:hypothetical protein
MTGPAGRTGHGARSPETVGELLEGLRASRDLRARVPLRKRIVTSGSNLRPARSYPSGVTLHSRIRPFRNHPPAQLQIAELRFWHHVVRSETGCIWSALGLRAETRQAGDRAVSLELFNEFATRWDEDPVAAAAEAFRRVFGLLEAVDAGARTWQKRARRGKLGQRFRKTS